LWSRSVVDVFRRLKKRSTSEPAFINRAGLSVVNCDDYDTTAVDSVDNGCHDDGLAQLKMTTQSASTFSRSRSACKSARVFTDRQYTECSSPHRVKSPGRRWFRRRKYNMETKCNENYKDVGVF
jgi:hypothetical protein